ncbi:hypothetical protein NE237_005106 [Protea cynaroides]|uniref:DNA-directed RNA polymerases I and III subunit RPAC2 n=1 Tax=Protea cynaroides TaxID=273540 RepID=A0A9Q0KJZ2_9MAGN|nr:hypothetical protein NE237_005106 [Protea cynaroides]
MKRQPYCVSFRLSTKLKGDPLSEVLFSVFRVILKSEIPPRPLLFLSGASIKMEHGSLDDTKATFSLADEDHTLANSVRFALNQDPRVTFCGYSIPHPSDARVNIRVQTTGDPAKEVLKDAFQDLMGMCQHVRTTFDKAVVDFKTSEPVKAMNINP